MPHRGQPARHARGLEAAQIEIGKIVPQRLGSGAGEALAAAGKKFGEIVEVAPIGVERVVAGALFGREHVEEQADQLGV